MKVWAGVPHLPIALVEVSGVLEPSLVHREVMNVSLALAKWEDLLEKKKKIPLCLRVLQAGL